MSKNITIQEKMISGEYKEQYPSTSAVNVTREAYDISYIYGDNLLEVGQYLANVYCAPIGDVWHEIDNITIDGGSVICSYGNFVAILTIYNNGIHYLIINYSYDGGETWSRATYSNSNTNYSINYIIDAQASIGNNGDMEVVFIGKKEQSSTLLTTYKIIFDNNAFSKCSLFGNQINLNTGGVQ